jgi:hypothetical protein
MSRDQWLILASAVIPLALISVGMVRGWRARRRRQADVVRPSSPPADLGEVLLVEDLLYVATTRADAPLDRIVVAGLGFRSRGVLTVAGSGIRLDLAGANAVFLPTSSLLGVGRATWTIDRVVGNDGLVFVRWANGEGKATTLDSYFRSTDPAALLSAIERVVPADAAAGAAA